MEIQSRDNFRMFELKMQQQMQAQNQQLQVQLQAINAQLQSQGMMARSLAFAGASDSLQQGMVNGGLLNTLGIPLGQVPPAPQPAPGQGLLGWPPADPQPQRQVPPRW